MGRNKCCCRGNCCCQFCKECDKPDGPPMYDGSGNFLGYTPWMLASCELDNFRFPSPRPVNIWCQECSYLPYTGFPTNPPELPDTIDDIAELSGIPFTVGGIQCGGGFDLQPCAPGAISGGLNGLKTFVDTFLEPWDSFTPGVAPYSVEGSVCNTWNRINYTCEGAPAFEFEVNFWLCTSQYGRRIAVASVYRVDSWPVRYGGALVSNEGGPITCETLGVYIPLTEECYTSDYANLVCFAVDGVTMRLYKP